MGQFVTKIRGDAIASKALGRTAAVIGIVANISGLLADIEKSREEAAADDDLTAGLYTASAVFGGIAAIGGAILLFEAAAVSATVPVVGWVLAIIGAIGGIIMLILVAIFSRTPIEDWLAHCYWGIDAYKNGVRKKEYKKDLKFGEWKGNLGKELSEFFNLCFAYDVELKWITRESRHSALATLDEQAHVYVDLYNHGEHGRVITELRGLKLASKGGTEDRVDFLISSKDSKLPNIREVTRDDQKVKQVSWTIGSKDIPDDLHALYLTVAYDPFGNNNTMIPTDQGIFISLYKNDANQDNKFEINEKKNSYIHGSSY